MTSAKDSVGSSSLDPGRIKKLPRVQIIARDHPHFEEYGRFTGKVITMKFGDRTEMAEVELENCRHGGDGCFVRKGEVKQVPER